eukprot:Polyplicarium_translucidae@DN3231_c0_g2_i1.p1
MTKQLALAGNSVFVKNLSPHTSEEDVRGVFEPCDGLKAIHFKLFPGATQRYCQIDFEDSSGVTAATALNGALLNGVGMVITVVDPLSGLSQDLSGLYSLGGPRLGMGAVQRSSAGGAALFGAAIQQQTGGDSANLMGGGVPWGSSTGLKHQFLNTTESDCVSRTLRVDGLPNDWDELELQNFLTARIPSDTSNRSLRFGTLFPPRRWGRSGSVLGADTAVGTTCGSLGHRCVVPRTAGDTVRTDARPWSLKGGDRDHQGWR